MITSTRDLIRRTAARYHHLERRALAGRLGRWSQRRRWLVLVLVPVVALCCGGGLLGLPAVWLVRATVKAGQGAPSPIAAADAYLTALSYDQSEGLLPLLHDDDQDRLIQQWNGLRAAMAATEEWGAPNLLNVRDLTAGPVVDGSATVTAEVSATWWGPGWSGDQHRERGVPLADRDSRG